MDITGRHWTAYLGHVHEQGDRQTKAHIHTHRKRNQSAFTLVPPPPSKTCGPKAEKIAWHPLPWSMKRGQEEGEKDKKRRRWRRKAGN